MALRFNKATANDLARRAEALREIVDEMKAQIEEADEWDVERPQRSSWRSCFRL